MWHCPSPRHILVILLSFQSLASPFLLPLAIQWHYPLPIPLTLAFAPPLWWCYHFPNLSGVSHQPNPVCCSFLWRISFHMLVIDRLNMKGWLKSFTDICTSSLARARMGFPGECLAQWMGLHSPRRQVLGVKVQRGSPCCLMFIVSIVSVL